MGLFVLQKRRFQGDLTGAFQYLNGVSKKARKGLFPMACSYRMRGYGLKFEEGAFLLGIRKTFFRVRVKKHCNTLSRDVMNALQLDVFKARSNEVLSSLV